MAENIELRPFHSNASKDSDIEEYHEINHGDTLETTFSSTHAIITLNEHDFFSQYDVKTGKKDNRKKKKGKKKEKLSNLIDVISCELASVVVPIKENVINVVDYTNEQRSSYLQMTPRTKIIYRRNSQFDSEQGWGQNQESVDLSPKFPKVLENIATGSPPLPVEYIKPTKYNDLIAEINFEERQTEKFLNIEIKDINFKIHHQYSLEKLLSVKLTDLYDEYNSINTSLKDFLSEIKVNRETRDNLKQELLKISPDKKEDLRFDQIVRKYTGIMLEFKAKYLNALHKRKEMIHKMGSLWSDIEMIRDKTGHTDTPIILSITKKAIHEEEYDKEWNEVFKTEFSDMLDKLEYEYVNKYIEYKEVKYEQNLDDSTKRRISKPKLHIDEDALKDDVEEIVNKIVTKDKIDVHLIHDNNIVSKDDRFEKNKTTKLYFEIYVDDTFVCKSDIFSSNDIEFTEFMSLQILSKNSDINIVLSENNRETSGLKINIADVRNINGSAEFKNYSFVYNDIIEPSVTQIGSGYTIKEIAAQNEVRLKSSNMFKGHLYTICEVKIKLEWNEVYQNQSEAVINGMKTGRQIKRFLHGIDKPNTDALTEIIGKLYNSDVSNNEAVLKKLRNLCKMEVSVDDTFPIDENSPEFIRLKLLHLRNNGGMNNVENKMIPLHASQISTEQLNCLQKSTENDIDVQYFQEKYSEMDSFELQRFIGAKYLQKLNKNMLNNLNEHLLRKTHKDVVRDFKDLSLRTLFSNQSNLTLANISSSAKQQLLAEALGREQEIKITVLRAFNLPDRSMAIDEGDSDQIAGFKVHPLRPFVRLSYNGISAQTAAAIGCYPSWSQTVRINTRPAPLSTIQINVFDEHKTYIPDSDDDSGSVHYRYSSGWLGGLQIPLHTVLSLGIFRGTFKLTTPPMYFDYENSRKIKEATQSFIPAVNQLMKKETSYITLHITTSLSHLGGLHGYNQPIPNSEDNYLINHVNAFVTEYVNDFPSRNISLAFIDSSGRNKCVTQFLQPLPLPDYECFPKNPKTRSESALSKSSGLSKSSSSKSSGKRRDSGVTYQGGEERESIYSTMSWKNGDNQLEKIMNAIARYVSLVPTYEVSESHTVTLMGLELLKILHGSPLDHTILLASYFLYLGIRCWVAIGLGLPRGQSSYVITKYDLSSQRVVLLNDQVKTRGFLSRSEGYTWYVHDAVSGDRSELRDVGCPLKTVDFVFDNENIWVNVQTAQDCESVCFDFSRSSDWQPVFDKAVFVMKQPVLTDPTLYIAPPDVERLRATIETKVREKVQKWRSHMKTIWNRYCSSLLREMLPHWEYYSFNPSEPKPVLSQRLKQLMATYKMFGFPLNVPYVNTKSVVSALKATGVHSASDPNVEFGLAVEVCAYPNNVLSVWVFLASITRL